MRLSPFHIQLAKEFALGKANKDILADYNISDSRLSVIKANPLFKREIDKQKTLNEDKYTKALEVLEDAATDVAKELVSIVKNPAAGAEVRSRTAENILNRVAQRSQNPAAQTGNELVFEQLLRVTKRTSGQQQDDAELSFDPEEAYKDLLQDLTIPTDDEILTNVTPESVSFTQTIQPNTPLPTIGNNGGEKKYSISPKLEALLRANQAH
jgi:hypothetical protein